MGRHIEALLQTWGYALRLYDIGAGRGFINVVTATSGRPERIRMSVCGGLNAWKKFARVDMSQNEAILEALQAGRRLTPLDALKDFGCMRLSARIYDLRHLGHDIQDETVTVHGRIAGECRVKSYFMED